MIRYALACDAGHRFDSWFGDSAAFDSLARAGLVSCPNCGSTHVAKTIMAPAVARLASAPSDQAQGGQAEGGEDGGGQVPAPPAPPGTAANAMQASPHDPGRELRALVRAMRSKVMAKTQDVGPRFPEEVRRMHDGDIPHRDIRGEATLDEARSLLEDGIMILPVPGEPGELN